MFAIRTVANLFHAHVENLLFRSDWIRFIPKSDKFEDSMIKINVGTADSIPMILQTVIPAVSLSGRSLHQNYWWHRCKNEPHKRLFVVYNNASISRDRHKV
jgi:hypothetical protein